MIVCVTCLCVCFDFFDTRAEEEGRSHTRPLFFLSTHSMGAESSPRDPPPREPRCPFRALLGFAPSFSAPAGACPFSGGGGAAPAAAPPGATCPLGYTSSSPPLTLHSCVRCKGILYDATRIAACGHIFCGPCVRPSSLCLLCGASVSDGVTADAEAQAAADAALEAAAASAPDPAEAWLAAALTSAAGGAHEAALARLARAAQALPGDATVARAAVAGVQGDLLAKAGQADAAQAAYEAAVALFDDASSSPSPLPPDAAHALAVSLGKLGDALWVRSDGDSGPAAARPHYERALRVRLASAAALASCDAGTAATADPLPPAPDAATAAAWTDVGLSAAKLADADAAARDGEGAGRGFALAARALAAARAAADAAGSATAARAARLASFLEQQQQ